MTERSYIIRDVASGQRLGAARDPLEAELKAELHEADGHVVAVDRGVPFRRVPGPWKNPGLPYGYALLPPRPLATSTLRSRPASYWSAELQTFPTDWGRWGEGHTTSNVAHALHDRGLIEIAVPIKGRGPYLYRQCGVIA